MAGPLKMFSQEIWVRHFVFHGLLPVAVDICVHTWLNVYKNFSSFQAHEKLFKKTCLFRVLSTDLIYSSDMYLTHTLAHTSCFSRPSS